jgi:hypothetical protein
MQTEVMHFVEIGGTNEHCRTNRTGKPSYTVSIMEFGGDRVARETQYFAESIRGSSISRSIGRTDGFMIR